MQLLQTALFSGTGREFRNGKRITRGIVLDETMLPNIRKVDFGHRCVFFSSNADVLPLAGLL
jgi:hypothetical protein